jgi:mono/diheme cytochrome c family protein
MLVTAIGCGGGGTGTETADGSETAGGEATQYDGPIASTDAERGAERFETFCGGCHPGGQEDVGPSLIAEPHSAGRIRQQIREGAAQMRPFSAGRLSDADMETILAYMATIGAVEGVAATAPAAPTTDAPAAE